MQRPSSRTAQLHETPGAAPTGARVIEADYVVVSGPKRSRSSRGKPKRSIFEKINWWVRAITITAIGGFLIPPAFLLARALFSNG